MIFNVLVYSSIKCQKKDTYLHQLLPRALYLKENTNNQNVEIQPLIHTKTYVGITSLTHLFSFNIYHSKSYFDLNLCKHSYFTTMHKLTMFFFHLELILTRAQKRIIPYMAISSLSQVTVTSNQGATHRFPETHQLTNFD